MLFAYWWVSSRRCKPPQVPSQSHRRFAASVLHDLLPLDHDVAAAVEAQLLALDQDVAVLLEHDGGAADLDGELLADLDQTLLFAPDGEVVRGAHVQLLVRADG